MRKTSKKWLGVLGVLLALAAVAFFYPLVRVLAPAGMSVEVTSDVSGATAGSPVTVSFKILDKDGEVVKEFELSHEKLLHLVVVRDDLQDYQHLHPALDSDTGEFSLAVSFPEAGPYTVFEDFVPEHGEHTILSFHVNVEGEYAAATQTVSGAEAVAVGPFMVTPHFPEVMRTGEPVTYSFDVTREGESVTLENYLGASGHSVILHQGDLDYLHSHAEEATLNFATVFEKTGLYKAFTQFQVDGVVYEVDSVFEVGQGNGAATMDSMSMTKN